MIIPIIFESRLINKKSSLAKGALSFFPVTFITPSTLSWLIIGTEINDVVEAYPPDEFIYS